MKAGAFAALLNLVWTVELMEGIGRGNDFIVVFLSKVHRRMLSSCRRSLISWWCWAATFVLGQRRRVVTWKKKKKKKLEKEKEKMLDADQLFRSGPVSWHSNQTWHLRRWLDLGARCRALNSITGRLTGTLPAEKLLRVSLSLATRAILHIRYVPNSGH